MELVVPKAVTLDASNVAEDTHAEWASGTTYASGDRVYVTLESDGTTERTPHQIFESLTDSNTGNFPPDSPQEWSLVGATNRWAMLDQYVTSQTTNTDSIAVTLGASKIDRLALFRLQGQEVRVVVKDGDGTVIDDTTLSLRLDESTSWSEYFFSDIQYRQDLIHTLPGYYQTLTVELTITAATGETAACGHVVLGLAQHIGDTRWGATAGIADYSRKETNSLGETQLTQRDYSKTLELDLFIKTQPSGRELDRAQRALAAVRATPVVFDANNTTDREAFLIYGFYRDFDLVAQYAVVAHCSLEIEGLI
jgi:hypothetical protein